MTYSEKLKDPKWKKRRDEILELDKHQCLSCGDTNHQLNVHHLEYYYNLEPWEYEDEYLVTLCERCHTVCHWLTNGMKFNHFPIPIINSVLNVLENGRVD